MQISTVLLIILAAIVAIGLALFQYYYKVKKKGKLKVLLSFLRFTGLFVAFLLLINPKFSKNEYSLEKTNLIVLTDNSSSIDSSKTAVKNILDKIKAKTGITEKFELTNYSFGSTIEQTDSISFQDKNTNISKALQSINAIYAQTNTAVILLTDGNSTLGKDYVFSSSESDFPVYPIAIGDTTQYEDLRIDKINSNRYAFLDNKYPVEIYTSYTGNKTVTSQLTVAVNGENVHRENVTFSAKNNAKTITVLVNATTVGAKNVVVSVSSLPNERNVQNNTITNVVEVIDEKTNVAIISNIKHPDIGALKKAIETNQQRSVQLKKPTENLKDIDNTDLFILYQPDASFTSIYRYLQKKNASVFTILGEVVDSRFLNGIQNTYQIQGDYPVQETFAVKNSAFTKFDIADFSVDEFPPLANGAGIIQAPNAASLLQMKILGATLDSPLLIASDNDNGKELVLFGENIWKWRVQSFRNDQSFDNFDDFIGKLMLYLASNKSKVRLNVDYESFYNGTTVPKIRATYFDEAFVFNANASLQLSIKNKTKGGVTEIPMLLKSNFYEADLSDLLAGQYNFTVKVKDENRTKSGAFTILDFDIEKQFLTANYKKLQQLAAITKGGLYFPNETDILLQNLEENSQFTPTQKGTKNIVSLIDFRVLLALIALAFGLEWFIRKYNGLI